MKHRLRVIVASENPVKLLAAAKAFEACFMEVEPVVAGVSVSSGVGSQPISEAETLRGALNRTACAAKLDSGADYWVGLEGGIEDVAGEMRCFAWGVVRGASGKLGKGRTATFTLPPRVAELVRQGKELGEADDIVFGQTNSKQKMGAVGLLTNGLVDRAELYTSGLVLALIPFLNEGMY